MPADDTFSLVALFALSAMVVNGIGILAIHRKRDWAEKNKEYFMCFAAGVLIASPLIMAFPQAVMKTPFAGLAALGGFVYMFFSNEMIKHRTKQTELAFGVTALQGIGIHSFIDGIIYSVTFSAGTATGILAGTGLVAHEFAEGVITYSFLVKGGLSERKALLIAFLVASLTTPLGAFITYPLIDGLSDNVLGLALGFVVGVLVYVSASHLLPEARVHGKQHSYLAFLSGIALSLALYFFKG